MLVADLAGFIDHHQGRDTTQFEQIPFLPIKVGNGVMRVRQANEGQVMLPPIGFKGLGIVRPDHDYLGLPPGKFRVILAQLRHVPAAVGSGKAAVENQDDILALKIRQAHPAAVDIGKLEVDKSYGKKPERRL